MERETGIEPASSAWKAGVLPLNYSRLMLQRTHSALHNLLISPAQLSKRAGGGGWIRTSVGVSQQIYSLPPLATRAPLHGGEPQIMFVGTGGCQTEYGFCLRGAGLFGEARPHGAG